MTVAQVNAEILTIEILAEEAQNIRSEKEWIARQVADGGRLIQASTITPDDLKKVIGNG